MKDQFARELPWFQRSCLVVSNLDNAFKVYRDLLGFSLEYSGVDAPDAYSYDIFNIDSTCQTRFATLSSSQQQRTLALVEVPNTKIYQSTLKISATVIQVPNVADVLTRASALSLHTLEPRVHEQKDGVAGRVEAAFYDFDGHPIVIYQLKGN